MESLVVFLVSIIVILILYIGATRKQRTLEKTPMCSNNNVQSQLDSNELNTPSLKSSLDNLIAEESHFRDIDKNVNRDDLTEPIQRYPTNYYPRPPLVTLTNISTHQLPDTFSFLGNLHREYDNKIMKLYGRRRYNDVWDYYAIFNSPDQLSTKVNIKTKNNQEIFDQDEVKVSMFGDQTFKVFLNKKDEFSYSPYLF